MHPQVIQDDPGSCPICGMDLVPLEADDIDQAHEDQKAHRGHQGAMVRIDPTVVQNMNVTTEPVGRRDIIRRIRTVGYLDYDQDRMVTITTKYPGFVERVYVNYVGQPIAAGDALFEVYSPELVQTQQELLSAIRYAGQMSGAPEDARARADALVAAARQRLDYWDITGDQIDSLISTGEIARTLTVTAQTSGVAMQVMHGLEGARIEPGMDAIHIAGLETMWLNVELFEDQLSWVTVGTPATVTWTYLPGETFRGHIRFIKPEVDERTRTVQLTLEVPNPRGRLRVGMYATVVFEPVVVRDATTVPSQAVLRTGERDLVVVALGDGRFAPREVALGAEGDGVVQVHDGLSPGDVVVTSAHFLIDSESNLRDAISKMSGEARPDLGHSH
jgi:RND family efflux transporter MFP subunit